MNEMKIYRQDKKYRISPKATDETNFCIRMKLSGRKRIEERQEEK
jgi:hypothetical protein